MARMNSRASCIRNVMVTVDPAQLATATARFCRDHGCDQHAGIAIDGKTIRGAVEDEGRKAHVLGASSLGTATPLAKKTVLTIEEDGKDKETATDEIGVFIPAMELIPDIGGRTVTVDALLTPTAIATNLHDRSAEFVFISKGNRKTLSNDIMVFFFSQASREPDFAMQSPQPAHGRIEKSEIRTATEPVADISFPWVEQVFLIKRTTRSCRRGREGIPARIGGPSVELVYGIASHTPQSADAAATPGFDRRHRTCKITCIGSSTTPQHGTKTSAGSEAAMARRTSVASED